MSKHQQRSDGNNTLALTIVIALVIVIIAFFFTFPSRGSYANYGVPNGEETSPSVVIQHSYGTRSSPVSEPTGYSERLNTSTRTQDQRPPVIRENGLPSVAIPD